MHWFFLIIAGLLEIGWAIGMKYTEGFSKLWPSVLTVAAMLLSLGFLALHIGALVQLSQHPFSFAELWLPQLRSVQAALGITGLYLILLVCATSYLRRYLTLAVCPPGLGT